MIRLGIQKKVGDGPVWLEPEEIFRHILVLGSSGAGKTVFFQRLSFELEGAQIILDPSGDLAEKCYTPDTIVISKDNPICLNPLTRTYLDKAESANELTEVLNIASTVASFDKQMPMLVLMQRILRNCVRVGITDLKELMDWLDFDHKRRESPDKYWRHFDDKIGNFYKNREQVESARRISARLSLIVEDDNAYQFLKGKNEFDVQDIVENERKVIFNLRGLDPFITAFIGGLVAVHIRSYYQHIATKHSEPLYFFCDEIHNFISEHYSLFFVEARKFNIGCIVSLHSSAQVRKELFTILDTCYTKINLKPKFEADIVIGDKKVDCRLFPPLENTYTPQESNFLREDWITPIS